MEPVPSPFQRQSRMGTGTFVGSKGRFRINPAGLPGSQAEGCSGQVRPVAYPGQGRIGSSFRIAPDART